MNKPLNELAQRSVQIIAIMADDLMSTDITVNRKEYIKKLTAMGNLAIDVIDALNEDQNSN